MAERLQRQHVLVTGGSKGIGAAIVEKALAEGALVSFIDVDTEAAHDLRSRLHAGSDRLLFFKADVRDAAQLSNAHVEFTSGFGPVTGLVNNAGRNSYADPVSMTEDQWDDVFSVDLKSAWLCARLVLPDMRRERRGSIVNIASIHADMTTFGMFPYAAAKSGLVGLTRSLALEEGPNGIRVNALSPGYTATALVEEFLAMQPPDARERVLAVHPMGRIGTPAEIANCVAFLLSEEASFVTGANWRADGGLSARFA